MFGIITPDLIAKDSLVFLHKKKKKMLRCHKITKKTTIAILSHDTSKFNLKIKNK